ncbi:MAG TPA: hypothetical protein VF157_14325 [Chloroflexota bacterium]
MPNVVSLYLSGFSLPLAPIFEQLREAGIAVDVDQRLPDNRTAIGTDAEDALFDLAAGAVAGAQYEYGLRAELLVVSLQGVQGTALELGPMLALQALLSLVRHLSRPRQ